MDLTLTANLNLELNSFSGVIEAREQVQRLSNIVAHAAAAHGGPAVIIAQNPSTIAESVAQFQDIAATSRGQKIPMVKALRALVPGMGLTEAKQVIEAVWASARSGPAPSVGYAPIPRDMMEGPRPRTCCETGACETLSNLCAFCGGVTQYEDKNCSSCGKPTDLGESHRATYEPETDHPYTYSEPLWDNETPF